MLKPTQFLLMRVCLILFCGLLLAACTKGASNSPSETPARPITQTRDAGPEDLNPAKLSTAERFSMGTNPHQGMGGMGSGMGMTASQGNASRYTCDVPEGWAALPANAMRPLNLQVAGSPQAECYLSVLSGDGGGLLANVNRWRKQMDLAPMDEAELAQLPKTSLLGKDAVTVSLQGTFKGMSGDKNEADFVLAGVLAVSPEGSYFLRMTGPADLIEAEMPKFEQVRATLKEGAAPAAEAAAQPAGTGMSASDDVHGAPASAYAWDVPAGWEQGPAKPMRLATFLAQDGTCECRLFSLGGAAGGLDMNLNRWRGQMGQPPLTADELAALPRWPVLGKEAVYIEIQGDYTGMSGEKQPGQTFLGLVCPVDGQTLFVIMVGPQERMMQETANFAAFCKSLR